MIDCGSTWNIVSQALATRHAMHLTDEQPPRLHTIDGTVLPVYGVFESTILVRDSVDKSATRKQTFLGMDLSGGLMIFLGLPWLRSVCPNINRADGTMSFAESATPPRWPPSDYPQRWGRDCLPKSLG